MRKIIYGPPGTGKTFYLMNELEKFLQKVEPSKIGYFTFSRNAAQEGKNRAMDKFNLTEKDLPYFRTLHSFCFNMLGLKKENVMQEKDYKDLGRDLQIEFEGVRHDYDHEGILHSKDPYISLISLARSKRISPIKLYNAGNNDYNITFDKLDIINKELYQYKKQKGLIDYIDMLEKFLDKGESPKFEVIFVDEAQDLSLIQWDIIKKLEKNSKQSIIAGDDDQAIYKWNGADAETFINLEGERVILQKSYRVPKNIFNVANNIIKKIKNRVEKNWIPKEELGKVNYHWEIDKVDLSKGEWLILARTNLILESIAYYLDQNNIYFQRRNSTPRIQNIYVLIENWNKLREGTPLHYNDYKKITNKMSKNVDLKLMKQMSKEKFYDIDTLKNNHGLKTDAEWYLAFDDLGDDEIRKIQKLIKNGEDLSKEPRIKISTIHGVKGNERDNVLLLTDLSNAAYNKYLDNPDDEHRLFYVGVTRAKKELNIIYPKTERGYDI
jgi:DNA helicase-2/ATP-dependent DNA helicase PcrA|tara:strand:- start:120 stop:1604 length:1485 start_codon:yes stop_codon:yes gene_type:complete